MGKTDRVESAFENACQQYADLGVDAEMAIGKMENMVLSLHCWQADDVRGFEHTKDNPGGGIRVTGNFPGRARNIGELKKDLEMVMSLLPGKQKINLHAIYGDFRGKPVDRDGIEVNHFQSWIDWARDLGTGLDFNPTCFSHPLAEDGFTLSSKNEETRNFWIEHVKRCRAIGAEMGRQLGLPCIHNIWIPDGSKDIPVDRSGYRTILRRSLDEIFSEKYPVDYLKDSVESKLFGIGSESMVVGSFDFYLGYAIKNNLLICLDNGHFHPTEQVGDKISSLLLFVEELLLHFTRGVRWDSDHVATFNDEIILIAQEIIRAKALGKVNIGLDFFDGSLNRIGAYIIGARAVLKSFLFALLEPVQKLKKYEENGQFFERLALTEELKGMPHGAVWDYYCIQNGVTPDSGIIPEVRKYERDSTAKRE